MTRRTYETRTISPNHQQPSNDNNRNALEDSAKQVSTTRPQTYEQIGERRFRTGSLLAGFIGGLAAASLLAGLIFAGDLAMGLPMGTFYSVVAAAVAGIL
jgi:hypothetical protein